MLFEKIEGAHGAATFELLDAQRDFILTSTKHQPRFMHCSSSPPLVTLITLTCDRPSFLRQAIRAAASQDYKGPIELLVVDDGPRVPISVAAFPEATSRLSVRIIRLNSRYTIGSKRNAAVRAARGAVLLHWDDDDFHPQNQVSALACPILWNMTDISCLTFRYLAKLGRKKLQIYEWKSMHPFLGSLAYSSRLAEAMSLSTRRVSPFPETSLSEDLHFVERSLERCYRMLPVSGRDVPFAYTRHTGRGVNNTWRASWFDERMQPDAIVQPPAYITDALQSEYLAAEAAASSLGVCKPLDHRAPPDIKYPLNYPYMPKRCCSKGNPMPRPCGSGRTDCGDSFCGATKGVCTSSCTCEGEAVHGQVGRTPCGTMCCRYWEAFWKANPQNCTTMRSMRPLKRHYCGERSTRVSSR